MLQDFIKECERFVAVRRHKMRRNGGRYCPELLAPWTFLGSGHFGEAWEHVDYPGLVLKISGRAGWGSSRVHSEYGTDCSRLDAWPVFARHCMAHPHRHLPTVLHVQDVSQGMTWGVLNHLYSSGGYTDKHEFINVCERALAGRNVGPKWLWPLRQMVDALGIEVDVHSGNVMYDIEAGCYVLTDPFSFREGDGDYAYRYEGPGSEV